LYFHREQWRCAYCKHQDSKSRPDLIAHIQVDHQKDLTKQSIDALLETCLIERIDATTCPLCKEYGVKLQKINQSSKCDVSLKQFQQHLGGHMQQLVLSVLPQGSHDEETKDRDEDDDSNSILN
jgi:hypothetical protein